MAKTIISSTPNTEDTEAEEIAEEVNKPTEEEIQKTAQKVEAKVEKTKKKIEKVTGERQNLIGDLAKPNVEDPEFDLKAWANAIDKKLDAVLELHKKKTEELSAEPPKPKKVSWLDKEIL